MTISKDALRDAEALIKSLETPYLPQVLELLKREMEVRKKSDITDAKAKIAAIAASVGLSVEEILSTRSRAPAIPKVSAKPVSIKYRHPENAELTWTGRGRAPIWINDWKAQHGDLVGITV